MGFYFRFLFFLPLHPAPRSLLLITDGPPLTMPCMHADARATEGVRGVWGGCGGWVWEGKVRTALSGLDYTTTGIWCPTQKRAAHDDSNLASERGGARKEEEGYRSSDPLCPARRCVRDGDLWSARVGCAWVCICAPRFFHVSGWVLAGPGAACSAVWCCLQGRAGQAGRYTFLSAALWCAGAVPHRGRDPGPRWHGVAWPMEVEVGIFSSGMDGFREMEGVLND